MALARRHRDVAHRAASAIREYWRTHKCRDMFYKIRVDVNFDTGEITSDMVNGWPLLRGKV